ncbi:MAG: zinc ribbon domain-containing protein [Spirochaetes bacterium]|nr:zinc ribbon domain-containing protein [Spirochaetota bacterium]
MPTYEYECRSCQHRFEKFQSMSDDPIRVCPACGGSVRRVIGGGMGVIFKGSGFYITDSKKTSAAASLSKSKTRRGEEAKAEASESLPAAVPESPASAPAAKKESA